MWYVTNQKNGVNALGLQRALGLTRINKSVFRPDTPEIRGMIGKITHLVVVEEQVVK